jgi:hypothetical protein
MEAAEWRTPFLLQSYGVTSEGEFEMVFHCRPGHHYTIEHTDSLTDPSWQPTSYTPTNTPALFADSSASPTGMRLYRVRYDGTP